MKKFVLFFTIISALTFSACKNDKNMTPEAKNFKVSFDLIVNEPDSLQFYYIDDSIPNFTEEKSIWKSIKGDSISQLVSFEIPEGYKPTFIRLDFNNKNQKDIKLNLLKVEYDTLLYVKSDSFFYDFFYTNGMTYNDSLNVLTLNKESDHFDPFIYSTDQLKEKLQSFK